MNRYVSDMLDMIRITTDSEEMENMAGKLNRHKISEVDVFVAEMFLATKGVQLQM